MIKAIAIDDEKLALDIIKNYCNLNNEIILLHTFTNPNTALNFIENNEIDIIFLDIEMPTISGLNFAKKISIEIYIIFTTAYPNFALNSFELNTIDYLLKPISIERFNKAIDKILYIKNKQFVEKEYFFLKSNKNQIKIFYSKIVYIEGWKDFIKIYFTDEKYPLVIRSTMQAIEKLLERNIFIRIHRSYIVSIQKISHFTLDKIYLNEKELPIGKKYIHDIKNLLIGR